jgi:hypothetical protein
LTKSTVLLLSTITTLLLFASCEDKKYTQKVCEELSMKAYKGFPQETKEFNDNCKHIKVKYTKAKCQKALQSMILGASEKSLISQYGKNVMSCFSKNDLKKFGPK